MNGAAAVEKSWFDKYVKRDKTPIQRGVVRPRIRRMNGGWSCGGEFAIGYGRTPVDAYQAWRIRWLSMQPGAWGCP